MRLGLIVSLLLAATLFSACGGSDDSKGGLLSGLNKDASSSQDASKSGGQDAKAISTAIAQLSGGTGVPNVPAGNLDPKALATAIAQLSGGGGAIPNLPSGTQDPKALATAIAQLSGGGSVNIPQGNSAATPDPCTLLTLDDAMTALKSKDLQKKKDVGSQGNIMGSRDCGYEGGGSSFSAITLTVISTAGMAPQMRQSGYNAKKQYDELKRLTKDAVAVKGIGDDAFQNGMFIHVLKKDVTFDIVVFTSGGDPSAALKSAATKVAGKLP